MTPGIVPTRRRFLTVVATTAGAAVAGCSSSAEEPPADADVVVGPDGRSEFAPAEVTVESGERLTWYFDSQGHNVSCIPAETDAASLPDGADAFGSHPDGEPMTLDAKGETYERTFSTPGRYVYVCVPHVADGMVGEVVVEE